MSLIGFIDQVELGLRLLNAQVVSHTTSWVICSHLLQGPFVSFMVPNPLRSVTNSRWDCCTGSIPVGVIWHRCSNRKVCQGGAYATKQYPPSKYIKTDAQALTLDRLHID